MNGASGSSSMASLCGMRLSSPLPRADTLPGCAFNAAARRKRHSTYPELAVPNDAETGGRFSTETVRFQRLLARHRATAVLPRSPSGWRHGPACLQSPHNEPSLLPCSSGPRQPISASRALRCPALPCPGGPMALWPCCPELREKRVEKFPFG